MAMRAGDYAGGGSDGIDVRDRRGVPLGEDYNHSHPLTPARDPDLKGRIGVMVVPRISILDHRIDITGERDEHHRRRHLRQRHVGRPSRDDPIRG
jgi:hypothetical protein